MKSILALFCMISMGVVCVAHSDERIGAVLKEYGLYMSAATEKLVQPDAPDQYVLRGTEEQTLLVLTNVVPARIGVTFGFKYALTNAFKAEGIKLKIVYMFPKMTNPISGRTVTRHEGIINVEEGVEAYVLYKLEQEWECVPGEWMLAVFDGDNRLVNKRFLMIPDDAVH